MNGRDLECYECVQAHKSSYRTLWDRPQSYLVLLLKLTVKQPLCLRHEATACSCKMKLMSNFIHSRQYSWSTEKLVEKPRQDWLVVAGIVFAPDAFVSLDTFTASELIMFRILTTDQPALFCTGCLLEDVSKRIGNELVVQALKELMKYKMAMSDTEDDDDKATTWSNSGKRSSHDTVLTGAGCLICRHQQAHWEWTNCASLERADEI